MESLERILVGAGSLVGALFIIVRYVLREERTFTERAQARRKELEAQVDRLYAELTAERETVGLLQREVRDLKLHIGHPEHERFEVDEDSRP